MHYHHNNKTFFALKTLFITCVLISLSQAAMKEACDLHYMGDISELKDSSIRVPDKVVSLSAKIKVEMPLCTTSVVGSTPSILFLIDHSGSMFQTSNANDVMGQRFAVAQTLMDTLRKVYPKMEASLVVFRQFLYFYAADNNRFVKCLSDSGAYLPFFHFDSSYAPDGKLGYQIVRELLDTASYISPNAHVGLKYTPTNPYTNSTSTNINVAFDVARSIFPVAKYPPNRQFIIFISDGEANVPSGNTAFQHVDSAKTRTPTTLTVFLTRTGAQPPTTLVNMTNNVKASTYSSTNIKSQIWAINVSNLLQLMLSEIKNIIVSTGTSKPLDININGCSNNIWDSVNMVFTLPYRLPLTGTTTDFSYKINYRVFRDSVDVITGDTIIVVKDSTTQGSYKVVVDPTVVNPPTYYKHQFDLICWKRDLQFYFNDQQVSVVNSLMTPLQLRFMYSPDEAQFQYTKAEIEVITRSGSVKDKETFILTKNDTVFTKFFPVAVDLNPTQNNGVLQVQENDTLVAVYRNNEIPKLPLDSVFTKVIFDADAPIHFVSGITKGGFSFTVIKNGISSYSLKYSNLPYDGKVTVYTISGRNVYEQQIIKGTSSIHLPKNICPALYFVTIEYHNRSLKKKILIQ